MRERSGVILLVRLIVPHGVRAHLQATIPHLAGVWIATGGRRIDPPRAPAPGIGCRQQGRYDVCTQPEEWCPMPAALWRMHLVKRSGPAGPIRIDFVVGPPPAQP